jgi:hypothetical protein
MSKQERKHRQRARRAERDAQALAVLRDEGARCGNCSSFERYPLDRKRFICDLHSDFHGYQMATADGLCLRWDARAALALAGETP